MVHLAERRRELERGMIAGSVTMFGLFVALALAFVPRRRGWTYAEVSKPSRN